MTPAIVVRVKARFVLSLDPKNHFGLASFIFFKSLINNKHDYKNSSILYNDLDVMSSSAEFVNKKEVDVKLCQKVIRI